MKKNLFIKTLTFSFLFLLSPFSLLLSSAQPYTVYECNFDNWTGERPDGWSFQFPVNGTTLTVSQYTPPFSGLYSCKVESITGTPAGWSTTMTCTESFPMYYDKKYTLSFTAKMIRGTTFFVSITNSLYDIGDYLREQMIIVEDTVWNNYEIEFISKCYDSSPVDRPVSSFGNVLTIRAHNPRYGGSEGAGVAFIIDNIKLVAKDHTMEFDYLEANNIKAYIDPIVPFLLSSSSQGVSFDINYFEAPKNSKKSTIFASNLWLGCTDNSQQLYVAAQTFCQRGRDFWLGPVTNDYDNERVVSNAYRQKYHHTWKVSKAEIEYHKVHYANPSYVMPWGIANWPAHGRTEYGESANLAPWSSAGGGWYSPSSGDCPKIRGDEAVFFITNDALDVHTESGSTNSLKVNVLGMAYAFNSSDPALQNTIFLSYKIQNRSAINYYDFYFGFWTDFEIGYANDDYVGCDTSLNLMYGYNGTEIDGSGQSWAYGENPPAQGAMFLNQKMSAFVSHNNNSSPTGDPRRPNEYYNYLRAIWLDGRKITYGGDGYTYGTEDHTNFMFSGDPVAGTGWTELTPNGQGSTPNEPGDRRGLMSAGPFTLLAGESICVDIALPFARDYQGGHLGSVALLKQYAQTIQQFYNEQNFNVDCSAFLGIKENQVSKGNLLIYPNPSNGQFTVASEKVIKSIELYDVLGKKVYTSTPKVQTTQINTHLPQGLYIYRAVLEDHSICSGKIVVQ